MDDLDTVIVMIVSVIIATIVMISMMIVPMFAQVLAESMVLMVESMKMLVDMRSKMGTRNELRKEWRRRNPMGVQIRKCLRGWKWVTMRI